MKNNLIPKHQHTWSPLVERNSSTYVARPIVIPRKATEQEKAIWEQSLHKDMKKVNDKWYPVKNEQIKADTRTEKQRKEEDAEGRAKYNDAKRKEQERKINNGIMTVGTLGALAAAQATPVGPYLDAALAAHGAYGLAKQADEGTLGANLETAGHTLEMLPLGIRGGVGLWSKFGKNVYLNFKYPVYEIKSNGTTSRVWLPATLNGTEINTNPFSLTLTLPLQLLLGYTPTTVNRILDSDGAVRLRLSTHTKSNPREFVLDPQGNNLYYIHMRTWDGDHVPAQLNTVDKNLLFESTYNELPDGAEILVPKSNTDYLATRGTIAGLKRLERDPRFTPGSQGTVLYKDKNGQIKSYTTTSFIKTPNLSSRGYLPGDVLYSPSGVAMKYNPYQGTVELFKTDVASAASDATIYPYTEDIQGLETRYTPESLKQYLGLSLATGNSSSRAPLFSEYVKSPLTYLLQMLSRYPHAIFTWNNLYPSFTPNGNGPIRYVGTTKMTPAAKRLIDINLERWQNSMFKTPEYKYISLPSGANVIKSWDIVKDRIKDLNISLYVPESPTTVTGFVGGGSDKVNIRLYPSRIKAIDFTMLHEGYSHPTDLLVKETELAFKGKNVKLFTLYNLLAKPIDIYGSLAISDNIIGSSLTGKEARAMANEIKLALLKKVAKELNIPVNEVTDDMIKNGVVKYINSPEKLKQLFKAIDSKYTYDYAKLLDLGTAEQNEHYLRRWLLALKHLPEIATAAYLTNNKE